MVQGKWKITIKTPMGDKSGVLELLVSGKTLTGSLSDADHHVAISDGKIEGNKLSWRAKISKPMRLSFKFTAIVRKTQCLEASHPPRPCRLDVQTHGAGGRASSGHYRPGDLMRSHRPENQLSPAQHSLVVLA